eukprot:m.473120 g.473120  ORF g.473120 m.473120 type:complete len:444 (-) comp33762_c0_seq1:35-1366(-)
MLTSLHSCLGPRPHARYLVWVEYLGPRFFGSARNGQGLPSVTCTLDSALQGLSIVRRQTDTGARETPATASAPRSSVKHGTGMYYSCSVHGSSRTDAGVHALGNAFHIDTWRSGRSFEAWCHASEPNRPALSSESFRQLLNHRLEGTAVRVVRSVEVPRTLHARHNASRRRYIYRIVANCGRNASLFEHDALWAVPQRLDLDELQRNAAMLEGYHDFSTFRSAGCQAKSAVRTVDEVCVVQRPVPFAYTQLGSCPSHVETECQSIEIHVKGRSFLYNQVRRMVGALVAAASPNPGPSCESLLNAKDSSALGTSLAPPNGLYLADVEYDQLDDMCRSVSDHDSCQAVTKLCHETALQLPCPEDGPFISSYTATSPLASVRFHATDTGWRCTLTTGDEGEYVREDTFPPPMEDHSYPFPIVSALIRGVWAEHLSQKPIHFPFPFN